MAERRAFLTGYSTQVSGVFQVICTCCRASDCLSAAAVEAGATLPCECEHHRCDRCGRCRRHCPCPEAA